MDAMQEPTPGPLHSVTLVRNINASAEAVYRAWTDPRLMNRWLGTVVEADVREGGTYQIQLHDEDGAATLFEGEYRVLEPGSRIVQTFSQAGEEPSPYTDEFLEVTFRVLGPALTEVRLTNGWGGQALGAEELEASKEAWADWLGLLAGLWDDAADAEPSPS